MRAPYHYFHIMVASAFLLLTAGCALYPDLNSDEKFMARASKAVEPAKTPQEVNKLVTAAVPMLYCGQKFEYAELCALVTDQELTELIGDASNTDRTFGYVFVGVGAAAAALAKSTAHASALKNLAIATGTLVGVRSVAQTDKQRQIATAARNSLQCMLEAAQLMNSAPANLIADLNTVASVSNISGADSPLAISTSLADEQHRDASVMLPLAVAFNVSLLQTKALAQGLSSALSTAQSNAPRELTAAVIRLRLSVRSQLASSLPSIDDLALSRRDAINSLMGDFLKTGKDFQVQTLVTQSLQRSISLSATFISDLNVAVPPTDSQLKAAQSIAQRCGGTDPLGSTS